jgi:hypothetical protein
VAQVVEQAALGAMRRSPGAIDRSLGGRVDAASGFGCGAAVEAPGGTHHFESQRLFDGADGVQVLPKSFGGLGVFGGLFGPDTVLGGEEAELKVISGGADLTCEARRTRR